MVLYICEHLYYLLKFNSVLFIYTSIKESRRQTSSQSILVEYADRRPWTFLTNTIRAALADLKSLVPVIAMVLSALQTETLQFCARNRSVGGTFLDGFGMDTGCDASATILSTYSSLASNLDLATR